MDFFYPKNKLYLYFYNKKKLALQVYYLLEKMQ